MRDTDAKYCLACGLALERVTSRGFVQYAHGAQMLGRITDHAAVAIPLSEHPNPIIKCDFCSEPHAQWAYVRDSQTTVLRAITKEVVSQRDYRDRHWAARKLRTETGGPGTSINSGERWAACEHCAKFIEERDIYGLISHVLSGMPAKYNRGRLLIETRGKLLDNFSAMFTSLRPGRGQITRENPRGLWSS